MNIFSDVQANQVIMITIESRKLTSQAEAFFQTRIRAYSRAPSTGLNPKIDITNALKDKLSSIDHNLNDGDIERVIAFSFAASGDADTIIQASANSFLKRLRSSPVFRINKDTNKYEVCTPTCKGAKKMNVSDIAFSQLRYGPITLEDFLNSIKTRKSNPTCPTTKNRYRIEKSEYAPSYETNRSSFRNY